MPTPTDTADLSPMDRLRAERDEALETCEEQGRLIDEIRREVESLKAELAKANATIEALKPPLNVVPPPVVPSRSA